MAKDILFFICTMGGGGSERVVPLLSKSLAEKGNNVYIITMYNKGPAYSSHENIHLLSVSELPVCSFFHRALTSAYQRFYLCQRQKFILPVLRKLRLEPIEIEKTLLFFYISFALPCREFLKSHSEATAFAFLAPAAISLASKRSILIV